MRFDLAMMRFLSFLYIRRDCLYSKIIHHSSEVNSDDVCYLVRNVVPCFILLSAAFLSTHSQANGSVTLKMPKFT
jgi:hypothetical protein